MFEIDQRVQITEGPFASMFATIVSNPYPDDYTVKVDGHDGYVTFPCTALQSL